MPRGNYRRGRSSAPKRKSHWYGIQSVTTTLPVTASKAVFVMIPATRAEHGPLTCVAIRGTVSLWNVSTGTRYTAAAKIAKYELEDGGAIAQDIFPLDTHEEDIARRQIWTTMLRMQHQNTAIPGGNEHTINININVKIIIGSSGKEELGLFLQQSHASDTNIQALVNLRALCKLH